MSGSSLHSKSNTLWDHFKNLFKKKEAWSFEETRFVVLDTETTGLDPKKDKILSIGAVSIRNNCMEVSESFECFLMQERFNTETVKIHGILKEGKNSKISELDALKAFLEYINDDVLIAHHAAFDEAIINSSLKNNHLPKLKNKTIDTDILYKKLKDSEGKHFSLDKLCEEFNIKMHDRHTAQGDAYITAQLFVKIISRIKIENNLNYNTLFYSKKFKDGLL
jgi:DNA polymerase-3 subunit epsilon